MAQPPPVVRPLPSSSSSSLCRRLGEFGRWSMVVSIRLFLLLTITTILHSPSGRSPPRMMMAHAWTTTTTTTITTRRKRRRNILISSQQYFTPPQYDRRFVVLGANDHPYGNEEEEDEDTSRMVPRNITQLAETKVRLAAAAAAAAVQEQEQQPQLWEDTTNDGTDNDDRRLTVSLEQEKETKTKEAAAHLLYQSVKQPQPQPQELQQDDVVVVDANDEAVAIQRRRKMISKEDCHRILQVHAKYYRAFSRKDADMMMEQVWGGSGDRSSVCIHPGHLPILGSVAISNSWQDLLETTAKGAHQKTWIEPSNIRLVVTSPTMAVITCDEHVYSRRFVRGHARQTQLEQVLQATHIFRRETTKQDDDGSSSSWYMMYHHSSWHADSELSKVALKQQQHEQSTSSSTTATATEPSAVAPGVANSGPLVIRGSANEVVESLTELLSGGGGSKLLNLDSAGTTDEEVEEDEDDIDNDEEDDNDSDSIIITAAMNDDDNDEDTPENDDDDDDDNNAKLNIQIRKRDARRFQSLTPSQKREECISTLRQLAKEGHISSSQKRILLTDIIRSSSSSSSSTTTTTRKKPLLGLRPPPPPHHSMSLVEVAYDLFYCETRQEEDDSSRLEEAKLEFAEQCRVFANSLEMDGGVSRRR